MGEEGFITASELQTLTGLNGASLSQMVSRGIIPRPVERGRYSHPQAIRSYVDHLKRVAAGRGGADSDVDLTKERALLAREQRKGHEIKNAALAGELVEAAAVERRWASILSGVRARMLGLPSDIAQLLPHLTRHDGETIDRAIRDALSEAADDMSGDD